MRPDGWARVCLSLSLLLGALTSQAPSFAPRAWAEEPVEAPFSSRGSDPSTPSADAIAIRADRIEHASRPDILEADGSVELVQGETMLTADHVTLNLLTGDVTAVGRVRLSKGTTDVWAQRLELNFNTEAGVISSGRIFDRDSNALITAEQLRRFSESHYRARDGSFTNCDAMEGQTPAWRFTFEDVDLTFGESLELWNAWFCVNDVPVIPVPYFRYPIGVSRKTGFLFPTPGYNTEFGFNYRQGFFWAIDPSQDLTVIPNILTNRGYGGDLEYRYLLSRSDRGQWLFNSLQDTEQDRARGLIRGAHTMKVTPRLSMRAKTLLVSDPSYLQQLGNASALRASPSAESTLDVSHELPYGRAYLLAQYLQPLEPVLQAEPAAGDVTFQRLPELGYRVTSLPLWGSPVLVGLYGTYDYFYRETGFDLNRVDVMPTLTTRPVSLGNVLALTPSVQPRGVYYSRGSTTADVVHRETIWSSLRASTRLRRQFRLPGQRRLVHTVQPDVTYEYVPATKQSDLVQIDNVDNLPDKNLLTYMLRNRLVSVRPGSGSSTWLDLTLAQSYHVANPPVPSPRAEAGTGVQSRRFSDVWGRAQLNGAGLLGLPPSVTQTLMVDAFLDPYDLEFSQANADVRLQYARRWYVEIGQRLARSGRRVQRGDIWNPLSFGQAFDPGDAIQFVTGSAALRLTSDVTVGGRILRDFESRTTPELDVVALYQNPCRCWSLGVYFQDFPDRSQFNFLISLRDIGSTDSFGAQLLQTLLGPLLHGEKGLPW